MDKVINEDTYLFKCHELASTHKYIRRITTSVNLLNDAEITEETLIDYRRITPTTFRSKFFQNEIRTKEKVQYIARTIPNRTGYHNGIEVTIFYFENNTLSIREFSYFIDTYKLDQIGDEVITPTK